jgi:hypothetical protein
MLQYIGQYRNIEAIHGIEFSDQARVYVEACFARYRSGGLIKFEPLHLEAIPRVEPQPAALIAPDIQKPARASPLMKRKCVTSVDWTITGNRGLSLPRFNQSLLPQRAFGARQSPCRS